MLRWKSLVVLALGIPAVAQGQATAGATPGLGTARQQVTVSLMEALAQAQANNPLYRQTLNDEAPARWGVRNAWSTLFLPSLDVSSGMSYTGVGESRFGGGLTNRSPAFLSSNYGMTLSWQLSGRTITGPGVSKATARAVDADINFAEISLAGDVTDQYLVALQATAQVEVARQDVGRNQVFLDLAQARFQLGQATLLDVRQAEATKAQSESRLLVTIQAENAAKLELFRRMGIHPPVAVQDIVLTNPFDVTEPQFDLQRLLGQAAQDNPSLNAFRAREDAAAWNLKATRSEFLPTLSARASWSGFTQEFIDDTELLNASLAGRQSGLASCTRDNAVNAGINPPLPTDPTCTATDFGLTPNGSALTQGTAASILDQNAVFPLDFTSQPFQASFQISLPIFTGFGRSLRVSEAQAFHLDADENVRAAELQVRAQVTERYLAVLTAYQAIGIEETSRTAAREQLRLAQDRYRLGSGNATELSDAQNAVATAEGSYVNAVYAYHRALTALEVAVGQPLR